MNTRKQARPAALTWAVAVASLPALAGSVRAGAITWDNGGNNFAWSTISNWNPNVEPNIFNNDDVTFPAVVPDDLATIVLSNGESARSLTFNNNYDLTGGTLTLGQFDPIGLTTAAGTSIFIDSTLMGTSGLTKWGSGTLTLLGNNSFTGDLKIRSGTVNVSSDAQLGAAGGGVAFYGSTLSATSSFSTSRTWGLNTGGTINVTSGSTLNKTGGLGGGPGGATLTKTGTGTLAMGISGAASSIFIAEGTIRLTINDGAGAAAATMISGNAGTTLDLAGFNQQVRGFGSAMSIINSGGAASTLSTGGSSSSSNFSGSISGNIALVHANPGTLTFESANSYTGGTTINGGGTLSISGDDRLGAAGTTLVLTNGVLQATETMTLSRAVVTSAAGFGINVDASRQLTIRGNVSGGGALNKLGAGTLFLAGATANTHGTTTVNAGTVTLANPAGIAALPGNVTVGDGSGTDILRYLESEQIADTANLTVATSGVVTLGTFTETIANLTMTGGQVSGAGATLKLTGDMTVNASTAGASIAPQMDLGGLAHLFTVSDGGAAADFSVSGQIVNGDLVKIGAGRMDVRRFRDFGALTILTGTVRLMDDDGTVGVSDVASLARGESAKLDVRDNKLIVTSGGIGSWDGSAYTGVAGAIDSGRGGVSNAQWDGSGIVTTDARAVSNNDLCSIGVATASQVKGIAATGTALWAGQTVTGSNVLVMFTWGGDANLDGKINIDDYGQIDFNVGNSGSVFGWYNGDFNYDGKINIDDYGIIDFNVSAQNSVFPTGGGIEGVAAVPEPALGILLLGLTAALGDRRCRSARSARR